MLLDCLLSTNAADMRFPLPAAAVHLGGFDCEEDAARAHDVMAMKCRGMNSTTNYEHKDYEHLLPRLEKLSKVGCLFCLDALSYALCTYEPTRAETIEILAFQPAEHPAIQLNKMKLLLCCSRCSCTNIMLTLLQDDVRQLLMRKASTFARGSSRYQGVARHKVAHRNPISLSNRLPLNPCTTPCRSHTSPQSSPHPPQVQCPALPCPAPRRRALP